MKLELNKKKLKNLSKDAQVLPENVTPNIAGGVAQTMVTCICLPTHKCPDSYNC